ncbi:hypothetical protein DPX39_060083500 [Trypanosoma brucei equiperdum]|uniref:Trypanosome variant surface glycoprotein (A-type) n=1 Tax=Trypanosoma brucei equiperdum TaxID=630700 RepID=A0A3L6L6W1_9TRYP|nr:hypothetical protein DPX39_060065200 [Trypanosoma brucei equiperdum]RHW71867.1 hypothetical protein DPX39_060077400 [Trypanosoma brucei equiperdum]RHW72104.1 hypothetical protein DPX39_060071300 [Trypanosoma brucei equiperdum]RHW72238.1 hypothetical protein DPX39_060083500 [Trypanosoma brucei equiperdum]
MKAAKFLVQFLFVLLVSTLAAASEAQKHAVDLYTASKQSTDLADAARGTLTKATSSVATAVAASTKLRILAEAQNSEVAFTLRAWSA